jgi:hypothetical protein
MTLQMCKTRLAPVRRKSADLQLRGKKAIFIRLGDLSVIHFFWKLELYTPKVHFCSTQIHSLKRG